jgi:hypothetical protein
MTWRMSIGLIVGVGFLNAAFLWGFYLGLMYR